MNDVISEVPAAGAEALRAAHDVTVKFVTLGCPKNEVDSNRMATLLRRAGYTVVDDEDTMPDVIVVNTCTFITAATQETIDVIFDLVYDDDYAAAGTKLIVAGCGPSRYGDEFSESLTEADAFLPVEEEDHVVEMVARLTGSVPKTDGLAGTALTSDTAVRTPEGWSAYVKISDGCNRFCSFCTIPFIRGRYHSRTFEDIASEIDLLVEGGVREIILIGQDTSIWGSDFEDGSDLPWLLDTLAKRYPQTWMRIMYLQPERLDDRLIDVFVENDNVCNYLDIPLQHCNAKILHDMNRAGNGDEFLATLSHMRERIPDLRVRTTLITGFPGEGEDEADELEEFVRAAEFDYCGVFAYSQEEGTRAGRREDQVPEDIRAERAQLIRDLGDELGFARCASHVGEIQPVLVEGYEGEGDTIELVGRIPGQAPEIDGGVHLSLGSAEPGDIVTCRLVDSFCYEYEGEVVGG